MHRLALVLLALPLGLLCQTADGKLTVRARSGRLRALSVLHRRSSLCGAFEWARKALNGRFRSFWLNRPSGAISRTSAVGPPPRRRVAGLTLLYSVSHTTPYTTPHIIREHKALRQRNVVAHPGGCVPHRAGPHRAACPRASTPIGGPGFARHPGQPCAICAWEGVFSNWDTSSSSFLPNEPTLGTHHDPPRSYKHTTRATAQ
jgi:hypothetical protein